MNPSYGDLGNRNVNVNSGLWLHNVRVKTAAGNAQGRRNLVLLLRLLIMVRAMRWLEECGPGYKLVCRGGRAKPAPAAATGPSGTGAPRSRRCRRRRCCWFLGRAALWAIWLPVLCLHPGI